MPDNQMKLLMGAVIAAQMAISGYLVLFERGIPPQPIEDSDAANVSVSGSQRLYPMVRNGDDAFRDGNFEYAKREYSKAVEILRELQEEFPERSGRYRDAERTVRIRVFLVEAAARFSDIGQ